MTTTVDHSYTTQWIGGRPSASASVGTITIHDPADATFLAQVPRGCAEDAHAAIAAADDAKRSWGAMSPTDRGAPLRIAAQKLGEQRDAIAELLVRENGKVLPDARAEVGMCEPLVNRLIELGIHLSGRSVQSQTDALVFQHLGPRGVAVCLNTWNAPVVAGVEMAAANLIVGNTVVLKTSERAPLATRMAFETCFDDLPSGVLSVLSGDGPNLGAPLVSCPETDLVCFIGSVGVGSKIGQAAGKRVRKAILELGGKDAFIIDDTVDPAAAAKLAAPSCFTWAGQICTSTERIFVVGRGYEAFVTEMTRLAEGLKVGPGLAPDSQMGPMIDEDILAHAEQQVDAAIANGATAVTGGKRLNRPGYYFPPTVLVGVKPGMLIMQDETFGPIAPVVAVDSFEEAIERANQTTFGLSNIVCTESAPHAIQAIHELEAGMIRINAPRGGVAHCPAEPAKNSGIGMGHGTEFLRELTHHKSVRWTAKLK